MASTAPSARPARRASRSSCEASGGFILKQESYRTSSSMSVKWWGVTSQVTRRPRCLAQRTCSRDAFAHDGAGGERNIFGVFHDGKIERAAVVHNLAGEFRGGNGLAIVGDSDDAGLLHGGNFGDVLACAANGSGADGPD